MQQLILLAAAAVLISGPARTASGSIDPALMKQDINLALTIMMLVEWVVERPAWFH